MAKDPCADFAGHYDLFHESFEQRNPERIEFFRTVFAGNNVESVLDCACGTGRDLALFNSLGLEAFGLYISESMLNVAGNSTPSTCFTASHGPGSRCGPGSIGGSC
jgi:ubiquinone/menaquinone biosynthesis C-methylase UbiE